MVRDQEAVGSNPVTRTKNPECAGVRDFSFPVFHPPLSACLFPAAVSGAGRMLLEQTMQQPFSRGGGCFPLADPRFMASVSAGTFSLWGCIFLLYPFKVLIHFMNNIHPSLFCAKNGPHFCKCCNHFRIIENWRAFHLSEISLCA